MRDELERAGLPPPIVTGAGTGSFLEEAALGVHTEVQPGSYVLMDTDYGDNEADEGAREEDKFENALWIHSSLASPAGGSGRVVIDAGSKAVDLVSGVPSLSDQSRHFGMNGFRAAGAAYSSGGDEHGVLTLGSLEGDVTKAELLAADRCTVRLIPRHVDPQVNLHDSFLVVEEEGSGTVTDVWNVQGRSPGF